MALELLAILILIAVLWLLRKGHIAGVYLRVNGDTGMAIDIPLAQPAEIQFEAFVSGGAVVPVPDSVEVTFSAEPAAAGDFTSVNPLAATFLPAIPGPVILRGRAFIDGQEWIAEQVVNVKVPIAGVRLRVNGQVE